MNYTIIYRNIIIVFFFELDNANNGITDIFLTTAALTRHEFYKYKSNKYLLLIDFYLSRFSVKQSSCHQDLVTKQSSCSPRLVYLRFIRTNSHTHEFSLCTEIETTGIVCPD